MPGSSQLLHQTSSTSSNSKYGTLEVNSIQTLEYYAGNTWCNNKQKILKAIQDLNLTKDEATSIRGALQENNPAQLGGKEKLLAVYNAMIKLKDDHRSYFHIGVTESYKVALAYINSLAVEATVGSITGTGYGAFLLNKQNYEMQVDKVVQKIKNNGYEIRCKGNMLVKKQLMEYIIEYRNSLRKPPSSFQIPTSPPRKGMSLPSQIIAVINNNMGRYMTSEETMEIWNILVEAMIDRSGLAPLDAQACANMIALAEAFIIVNEICDGQPVSNYAPLQKLCTAVTDYYTQSAHKGNFQPFRNTIEISASGVVIVKFTNRSSVAQNLRDSGITVSSSY